MSSRPQNPIPFADKGVPKEALQALSAPWKPNNGKPSPSAAGQWRCAVPGGEWTLAPDSKPGWLPEGQRGTSAPLTLTLELPATRQALRVDATGFPDIRTQTQGVDGIATRFSHPRCPVVVHRELLPTRAVPTPCLPDGIPPLVLSLRLENRSTKPVPLALALRCAAPSVILVNPASGKVRPIPGGQRWTGTLPAKGTVTLDWALAPTASGRPPARDCAAIARTANALWDKTTAPQWLVDAYRRAEPSPRQPSSPDNDPIVAVPEHLASIVAKHSAPSPRIIGDLLRALRTLDPNEAMSVHGPMAWMLAVQCAVRLAEIVAGPDSPETRHWRSVSESTRSAIADQIEQDGFPSGPRRDRPCQPSDFAFLDRFHRWALPTPVEPDALQRWMATVWNRCLEPAPPASAVSRSPSRLPRWLRAAPATTQPGDSDLETDTETVWNVASLMARHGDSDRARLLGAVAGMVPGAHREDIVRHVHALSGWNHSPESSMVDIQPMVAFDSLRLPVAGKGFFGWVTWSGDGNGLRCLVEIAIGRLELRSLRVRNVLRTDPSSSLGLLGEKRLRIDSTNEGERLRLAFGDKVVIEPGKRLYVSLLFQ